MKTKFVAIALLLCFSVAAPGNRLSQHDVTLKHFCKRFEKELEHIMTGHNCSEIYQCYADSASKLNSGLLFSDGLIEILEDFSQTSMCDSVFTVTEDYAYIAEDSYFLSLLDGLAQSDIFYKAYREQLLSVNDISPAMVQRTWYHIRDAERLSEEEKEFFFLHLVAMYVVGGVKD